MLKGGFWEFRSLSELVKETSGNLASVSTKPLSVKMAGVHLEVM